ncbi:hypothetical protein CFN78_00885 [Amycolatopsis antarctica]|uniref:GatB/YqeY n=1 Tax=Amycolatopsis antarctica TaxID=1854586 RepID=A0A263D8J4_9PSEU|nr:GatB/YqeY domain-containing protein [Amycolatopsis antarctica]OZM74810.1 hypothetical protein CFN78_00885 [Amycolatopsis antarctica]
MRTTMRQDLTTALKARDRVAVAALRSALAAIENAEAPPAETADRSGEGGHVAGASAGVGSTEVERLPLTESELRAVVEAEVRERSAAAAEYTRLGQADAAERLRAEAEVLNRYLHPVP